VEKKLTSQQLKELDPQQLKVKIFEAYKSCINASSDDYRAKYFGQLWSLIGGWCGRYLFKTKNRTKDGETYAFMHGEINAFNEAADEMVARIPDVITILVKGDSTIQVFDELNEFFKYLNRMLINKRNEILEDQLPESANKTKIKEFFRINRLYRRKRKGLDKK